VEPSGTPFLAALRGDLVVARCERQPVVEARLWAMLADYYRGRGRYAASAAADQQALDCYRCCGDWIRGAALLCRLATSLHLLGRTGEACAHLREAAALTHSLPDAGQVACLWTAITATAQTLEAPALVIAYGVQARAACQAQGDQRSELQVVQHLGAAYRATHQWEAATNCLIQSVILAEAVNAPGMAAQRLCDLGWLAFQQEQPAHACRYFEAACRVFQALADPVGAGRALVALGQGWARRGEWVQAVACWRRGQDLLAAQPAQDHNLPTVYLISLQQRLGTEGFEEVWSASHAAYQPFAGNTR
jgi:tetratricopeptide (TPR) repeat protein